MDFEGAIHLDVPQQAAKDAGLRYASDVSPGIVRQRRGEGFTYLDPKGRVLKN